MIFKYGMGGALLCDEPIEGITQELPPETAEDYGGKYMICETIKRDAAIKFIQMMQIAGAIDNEGWELVDVQS